MAMRRMHNSRSKETKRKESGNDTRRMIHEDPTTRQRVVYSKHCGDLRYDLVGDSVISKETIPVIGNWADYTGSAIVNTKAQMYAAGQENELQGTDARIAGEHLPQLNEVGQTKKTNRRRVIRRLVKV